MTPQRPTSVLTQESRSKVQYHHPIVRLPLQYQDRTEAIRIVADQCQTQWRPIALQHHIGGGPIMLLLSGHVAYE